VAVVQVVEAAAQALVEDSRRAKSERAVAADGETISVDGSSLGRSIELELEISRDVSGAAVLVGELAVREADNEGSSSSWAGIALYKVSRVKGVGRIKVANL
jgi:hypothetical protein